MMKTILTFCAALALVFAAAAQELRPDLVRVKAVLTGDAAGELMKQAHMKTGNIYFTTNGVKITGMATIDLPLEAVPAIVDLPAGMSVTNFLTGQRGDFRATTNGFEVSVFVRP